MVRFLAGRNNPADCGKVAIGDIGQDYAVREDHVIGPVRAETQVLDGVWPGPDRAARRRVVAPADALVVEFVHDCGMFEAGILSLRLVPGWIDQLHSLV